MHAYDDGRRAMPSVPGIGGRAMTASQSIGHSPNRVRRSEKQPVLAKSSARSVGAKPISGRPDLGEIKGSRGQRGRAGITMLVIRGKAVKLTIGS